MKVAAWAVFGALLVTVLVAPVLAGVHGTVHARAGEVHLHATVHGSAPSHPARVPAPAAARRPGYLVEARMGWAVS